MMSRDELRRATKDFRLSIRDEDGNPISQTEFGRLLGKSLNTVQRYETLVPPTGKVLAKLARLAGERQQTAFAEIFAKALADEIGPLYEPTLIHERKELVAQSEREWLFMSIAQILARDPEFVDLWPQFISLTKPIQDRLRLSGETESKMSAGLIRALDKAMRRMNERNDNSKADEKR